MEKLPVCRVCLAENVRMYVVVNKNLHELYERLTDTPFITKDNRPMLACFYCCTKLKQFCRFQRKCLETEELFAEMILEPKPLMNNNHLECFNGLIQSPMEHIIIIDKRQTESNDIKEELPAVCEGPEDIIEPEGEHQSDELELENLNHSYSDIKDVPAQHSESGSGDNLPLKNIKMQVETEKEESRKKRRVSDTRRSPIAKKSKLYIRGRKLEDVITEEQQQKEQTDTGVIQNTRNCTSKLIPKFKELTSTKPRVHISITNTTLDSNCRKSNNKKYMMSTISSEGIDNNDKNRYKENRFKCDICQRCFSMKNRLTRHVRIHSGEKPFKCDICQRCFSEKRHLTSHIGTHTGEKKFKCEVCQRSFGQKNTLTSHIRTHTGEKPFKCDVCQRSFRQKIALNRHIRIHTGEKPFKCDFCQRCFSEKARLTGHILIHAGEKPFKCDICQRSFRQKLALKRHIPIHTGKRPFKCDVCQRGFSEKARLKGHISIHAGEKPFKCDVCRRSYRQKITLISHIRTHTGEKPFKCDVCQHGFRQKFALTSHIRTHTGEKPFKCDICQHSFRQKITLDRHIRTHTGEKPFKCDICQRCFSQKSHLTGHIRTHVREKKIQL